MAINWKNVIKSPQGWVSLAEAAVVALGTAGIITQSMSGAIQGVLTAVLALIAAAGAHGASTKLAARAAAKPVAPTPPEGVRS